MKDSERVARLIEGLARTHDGHGPCEVGKALDGLAAHVRSRGDSAGDPPAAPAATSSGPAQVASPRYRKNYETIFGKKVTPGLA